MSDFDGRKNQAFKAWLLERADIGCELPLAHVAALATVAAGPIPTDAATFDRIADVLANHDAGHHAMPPRLPRAPGTTMVLIEALEAHVARSVAKAWPGAVRAQATRSTGKTPRTYYTLAFFIEAKSEIGPTR
jgi:hypothetical protein